MKYCRKLWPLLGLVVLLFYSCEQDDGTFENDSGNMSSHPFVQEAREYFEDYISMEMEYETQGLHPGLIGPDWKRVKVLTQPGTINVDVPLWTEATYEGSFYLKNDSGAVYSTDTYYTAILQKLIVVKSLEKDALSCYIATIIPDAEHATRNSSRIEDMFYSGDLDTKFSGTVMYSTVSTNYTIQVEHYKDGVLCEQISLFNASVNVWDDLEAMNRLVGAKSVRRKLQAVTRGEYGWEVNLPGFGTTAPYPPPPPTPPLPPGAEPPTPVLPPYPTIPTPPIQPPSGGGNNNAGGATSSTTPNVDKLYGSKSNLSAADKKKLEKELTELINQNKFFKLLFTLLVDGKVKLNFKIDSKLDGVANGKYDSGTQTILFANSLAVNSVTLREELVHAVQHNIVYGADAEKLVNKFNLELEAHLFPDIVNAIVYGTFSVNSSYIKAASYLNDKFSIAINGLMSSIIRNKSFSAGQFSLYTEVAKCWNPKSYEGTYLESLPPNFLYTIFEK